MLADARGVWGLLEPVLWLAGVLLIGAVVLMLAQRWKKNREAKADHGDGHLAEYRKLLEEGVISEQEFKRLQGLVTGRLKEKVSPENPETPPPSTAQKGQKPSEPESP